MRKQQIPAGNYLPPHDAFLRNLVSVLPLGWGPTHSNIITIIADTIISITTITIVRLWALAMATTPGPLRKFVRMPKLSND